VHTERRNLSGLRFSLGALLQAVCVVAVLVAAVTRASVFTFGLSLALSVAGLTVLTRHVLCSRGNRPFFAACAGIGWLGLGMTLFARFPITGTPLLAFMWWRLTEGVGGWFTFNASSLLGSEYLILTWLSAIAGGLIARWASHLLPAGRSDG
jgi:hypothetical protein